MDLHGLGLGGSAAPLEPPPKAPSSLLVWKSRWQPPSLAYLAGWLSGEEKWRRSCVDHSEDRCGRGELGCGLGRPAVGPSSSSGGLPCRVVAGGTSEFTELATLWIHVWKMCPSSRPGIGDGQRCVSCVFPRHKSFTRLCLFTCCGGDDDTTTTTPSSVVSFASRFVGAVLSYTGRKSGLKKIQERKTWVAHPVGRNLWSPLSSWCHMGGWHSAAWLGPDCLLGGRW